ncbi:MAG: hypothetical protein QOJ51_6268, partial [Acidobacteriaceae bacterium]|nr:hypothetical protein [Acidobacteriaceae bacterium]
MAVSLLERIWAAGSARIYWTANGPSRTVGGLAAGTVRLQT